MEDYSLLMRRSDAQSIDNYEKLLRDCKSIRKQVWEIIPIQQTLYHTFQNETGARKFARSFAGNTFATIQIVLIDSLAIRVSRLWDISIDSNSIHRARLAIQNRKLHRILRRRAALEYLYQFRRASSNGDRDLTMFWFRHMVKEAKSVNYQINKLLKIIAESEKSSILKSLRDHRDSRLAHSLDEISRRTTAKKLVKLTNYEVVYLALGSICISRDLIGLAERTDCAFDSAISIARKNAAKFWENQPVFREIE